MIKYITPVRRRAASGLVAQVYDQIRRDFGAVAEPFLIHSPAPALLAGMWAICRESLVVGQVPRELKELVATVVSEINQCRYCVDAHKVMLRAGSMPGWLAMFRAGQPRRAEATRVDPIAQWAKATRSPLAAILKAPPFPPAEAPEFIGTALCFHYINRMVSVLLGPSPLPPIGRPVTEPLAALWFRRAMRKAKQPGESLALLLSARSPAPIHISRDLSWATASPNVMRAFAGFAAALTEIAESVLPAKVRELVMQRVEGWSGEDPGLRRGWAEELVGGLEAPLKPSARLALLTALAPHQVDSETIEQFRRAEAGDERMVAVLSWSSFAAARKIASWLWPAAT